MIDQIASTGLAGSPGPFPASEVTVRGHVMRCRAAIATSPLARLLVPQGISQAADAVTLVLLAQLVVVADGGASPAELLQAIGAALVPIVTVGPFAGVIADRWPRRRTMIVGHVARAAVTGAAVLVPITGATWVGYLALGALLAVTRTLYTTRAAILPRLVAQDQLVAGDSLVLMVGMVAGLAGGAVGSVASWTVPEAGFVVAASAHLYAAARYRALPADLGGGRDDHPAPVAARARRAAWRVAVTDLRQPAVTVTVVATMGYRLLVGAALATVAQLVDARYGAGAPGYAATLGVASVGSFLGTLTAGRFAAAPARRRAAGCCLVAVVACALAAALTVPPVALTAIAVVAFGFQNLRVLADATVQGTAHDAAVGHAFAVYDVLYNVAFAAGAAIALGLATTTDESSVLAAIAAAYAIAAAVWVTRTPRTPPGAERSAT